MLDSDKLRKALEIQNRIMQVQESMTEKATSSIGDIEISVNGLLRITNVKINYVTDTNTLERSILSTANRAFELVSERSKREIAVLAQQYGLQGQ